MASQYENFQGGSSSNTGYNQQYPSSHQQPPLIDFYKQYYQIKGLIFAGATMGVTIKAKNQLAVLEEQLIFSNQIHKGIRLNISRWLSLLRQVKNSNFLINLDNFSGSSSSQMANSINQYSSQQPILSTGINVYQNQPRERYSYEGVGGAGHHNHGIGVGHHFNVHHQHQPSRSNANNNAMLITSSEQFDSISYSNQQQPTPLEPSPVNANSNQIGRSRAANGGSVQMLSANRHGQGLTDNFMSSGEHLGQMGSTGSNINSVDSRKEGKMHQIQIIDRNVAHKRRSFESKEAIGGGGSGNYEYLNQNPGMEINRMASSGVKSALSNYPQPQIVSQTLSQQRQQSNSQNQNQGQHQIQIQGGIKQINKMSKVERDPMMDMANGQPQHQQNINGAANSSSTINKRTLAKSQSQNRLVLLSQDMLNKNHPYSDQGEDKDNHIPTDKNSFFKEQIGHKSIGQTQDLLYKQHMQYSGGHMTGQKNWMLKATTSINNLVLSRMTTKSECTFCNRTSANGMISLSSLPHHCSSIYCSKDQQGMMIQRTLSEKYSTNLDYYNLKVVNDLIYNENTHIVSIFKDYLILDDINEFLKRSYAYPETKSRLPKLCSFYEKYSQVFPNYVVLPESKYMFKNIQRKQKLIDEQYQIQEDLAKKQHQTLLDEEKLFNTRFYNSYYSNMGGGGDLSMSRRQYEDQAKAIAEQAGRKQVTRIDQMKIDELVDRFLMKDSESNIQLLTSMALDFSEFQNSFVNQSHSKVIGTINDKNLPSTVGKQSSVNSKGVTTPLQQMQKQSNQAQLKNQQVVNQINQIKNNLVSNQVNGPQGKKSLDALSTGKRVQPQPVSTAPVSMSQNTNAVKKGKTSSFNNNGTSQQQLNRQSGQTSSNQRLQVQGQANDFKSSPRLQNKNQPVSSKAIILNEQHRVNNQASPATKDAITNYLQDCNIEQDDVGVRSGSKNHQHITVEIQNQFSKQGMAPLLSPGSTNMGSVTNLLINNQMLESPQIKSPPNYIGPKSQIGGMVSGPHSGSQTSLQMNQPHSFQANLSQQSRSNLKSQCSIPANQPQTITNMKKQNQRLSNGGASMKQQVLASRKNASPVPSQQKQGQQYPHQQAQQQVQSQFQPSSRNQQMNSNSTQKSMKSINIIGTQSSASGGITHTKYLSGGNDQYQKILGTVNSNSNMGLGYDTQTVNSSAKKSTLLQASRSKPGLSSDQTSGLSGSHQKQQLAQLVKQPSFTENLENDIITGEDCDDFGIADERFTSPDGNKALFQTIDDNVQGLLSQGRRSLEGLVSTVPSVKQGGVQSQKHNVMLLTSSDDKGLAQAKNYDQIKRHLEQCISGTVGSLGPQSVNYNNIGSIPSQQTFDFNHQQQQSTLQSNSKKFNVHIRSSDKFEEVKQSVTSLHTGYNRDAVSGSSVSNYQQQQNSQELSGSRNGTQKKQFESLKQKIKGQFADNQNHHPLSDTYSHQSASKTPHKQSTNSKKSMSNMGAGHNSQQMLLQQNRMSLESNQMLMMMPGTSTHINGNPLSSTSANGRQLSFSQNQLSQNQINYRSITNLQQRKTSNTNQSIKEASIENNKRLSGQNRQSFKELSQQSSSIQPYGQQQQMTIATSLNNDNKLIKRSATGKTLNIQDSGSSMQHTQSYTQLQNNYLQSVGSSSSITNPNYMANNQAQNSKLYSTVNSNQMNLQNFHQHQMSQQAANQVRVMTPSYSLASLSKVISPTTTTSPMTMTVSLANGVNAQAINRKQGSQGKSNGKSSALGIQSNTNHHHNPSISNTLSSSHSQNFLMQDKNSKLATSSIYQNSQKAIISSKAGAKSSLGSKNNTLQAQSHPIQISTTINQKLGRVPANHHHLSQNSNMSLNQPTLVQTFQTTPRGGNLIHSSSGEQHLIDAHSYQSSQAAGGIINPSYPTNQGRRGVIGMQQNMYGIILENSSQNISCTVSTENHSSNYYPLNHIAAKAIESNKHPKFMKTIEEFGNSQGSHGGSQNAPTYNTMLSASMGQGRGGVLSGGTNTLTNSLSQAQLEVKNQKNKIQTVVNSNQASIKRQTLGGNPSSTLSASGSISHFKSPSQQIITKKHLQGRQLNM